MSSPFSPPNKRQLEPLPKTKVTAGLRGVSILRALLSVIEEHSIDVVDNQVVTDIKSFRDLVEMVYGKLPAEMRGERNKDKISRVDLRYVIDVYMVEEGVLDLKMQGRLK